MDCSIEHNEIFLIGHAIASQKACKIRGDVGTSILMLLGHLTLHLQLIHIFHIHTNSQHVVSYEFGVGFMYPVTFRFHSQHLWLPASYFIT